MHAAKRLNDPKKCDAAKTMKGTDNDEQEDKKKPQRRVQDKDIIRENPCACSTLTGLSLAR